MKFENIKSGEIKDWTFSEWFDHIVNPENSDHWECSMEQFIKRVDIFKQFWKKCEEHEYFWYISPTGTPIKSEVSIYDPLEIHLMKQIGNYFESEEDAEKVVEKRKAWERLENKGFRFTGWATNEGIRGVDFEVPDSFFTEHNHSCISDETKNDLDLLFSQDDDDDDDDDYEPTNAEINDLTDMGYGG